MVAGIHTVKPGATLGDIGYAIQSVAHREGYSIVREYCGHGIGKVYHEQPNILHYGQRGQGLVLKKGMVFTIEPMVNAGKPQVKELNDGWTVITQDLSLSAQWEHMVAVTDTGFELLTPWPEVWKLSENLIAKSIKSSMSHRTFLFFNIINAQKDALPNSQ